VTPRVLVTNDDGIDSPGLHALARCPVELGWETIVVAPAEEASGTGAGLNAAAGDRKVLVERRRLPDLPDVEAYAVTAHPGLIALAACHDGFGAKPTLVLSGINRGPNIGRAIIHSGTVGAAITASNYRVSALAVSLAVEPDEEARWENATTLVTGLLPRLAALDPGRVLNLNAPNTAEVKPLRWAHVSTYGRVQTKVTRGRDEDIVVTAVEVAGELEPGTDAALLADGHATVTALRSISEDAELMGLFSGG
jgi:5'-nucleotidase